LKGKREGEHERPYPFRGEQGEGGKKWGGLRKPGTLKGRDDVHRWEPILTYLAPEKAHRLAKGSPTKL